MEGEKNSQDVKVFNNFNIDITYKDGMNILTKRIILADRDNSYKSYYSDYYSSKFRIFLLFRIEEFFVPFQPFF